MSSYNLNINIIQFEWFKNNETAKNQVNLVKEPQIDIILINKKRTELKSCQATI